MTNKASESWEFPVWHTTTWKEGLSKLSNWTTKHEFMSVSSVSSDQPVSTFKLTHSIICTFCSDDVAPIELKSQTLRLHSPQTLALCVCMTWFSWCRKEWSSVPSRCISKPCFHQSLLIRQIFFLSQKRFVSNSLVFFDISVVCT